mgnify:CR=1 FL=1
MYRQPPAAHAGAGKNAVAGRSGEHGRGEPAACATGVRRGGSGAGGSADVAGDTESAADTDSVGAHVGHEAVHIDTCAVPVSTSS